MEIWKEIKNYEGFYEVSNLGRVRRVDRYATFGIPKDEIKFHKGRILKQNLKRNGYFAIVLSKNFEAKTIYVHRLVAIAFVEGQTEENNYIDHINCNKQDNRAENLEWVSSKENSRRAKQNNLYNPPNRKQVRCKQLNKVFQSSYEAAEFLNKEYFGNTKLVKSIAAKIRSCCCGFQKNAYNFTWEYI